MRWLASILLLPCLAYSQVDSVTNFAKADVVGLYDDVDSLVVIATGKGALFPVSGFNVVWWNVEDYPDPSDDPNVEMVRVYLNSGDTLHVTRAQEGTAASTKNEAGKTYRVILSATAIHFNQIRTSLNSKLAASDTTSLSNRIGARADSSLVLFWPDTVASVATKYDVSLKLNSAALDTGTVLFWPDTVARIATNYDLTQIPLNQIINPTGATAWNLGANGITFTVSTPSSPAIDINGTGIFEDDLLHIHQHTGNPGAGTGLLHLEAVDADVLPFHVTGANDTNATFTGGKVFMDSAYVGVPILGSLSGTVRASSGRLSATASDTAGLGVALASKLNAADTTALSNRIGARADSATALYWADTTSWIATAYDLTLVGGGDTTSLSNRINAKADSGTVLYWADTTASIGTKYNLSLKLNSSDTTSIRNYSSAIYLKNADSTSIRNYSNALYLKNADSSSIRNYSNALYLDWADTTSILATQFDITQTDLSQLKAVDTAGNTAGRFLRWNGTQWVDSTQDGTVYTSVDSLVHKFVDSTGRSIGTLSKLTAVIYNSDSSKYKSLLVSRFDTTGVATASTGISKELYTDSTLTTKMRTRFQYYSAVIDSSLIWAGTTVGLVWLGDQVQIDTVMCVGLGTTNFTFNVHYGTDRSSVTDSLFDALQTANSTSTGNKLAVNDGDLAYSQFVWFKFFTITTKPTQWLVTLKGRLR